MAKGSVRKKGKKWYYRFYIEDESGNRVQKEFPGTENKAETEALLRKAMEKPPEKQKKLLEMRVFQEMEYARISELTGLSQVNVRVSLTLARKNLRNEMEKARRYEEA